MALPALLVKTARYSLLFWLACTLVSVSVVLVAPPMSVKVPPPSVLTCHCTVGAGVPLADAVKVAVPPTGTDWFDGWPVMVGATVAALTVRVAAVVVALPALLVKTARYSLLFWLVCVLVSVSVVLVAPTILLKLPPPSVLICHCTVGVGVPLADAVKVAVCPAVTV